MEGVRDKEKNIFTTLKEEFGYTSPMQTPHLEKIVVSVGTGSVQDKNQIKIIEDSLALITGQKPAPRAAKKSIASFKVRQGDLAGYQVTLTGARMYGFLDKLINIALPRTKDFRGISPDTVDEMGNMTIGIREHTIFPETSDEELQNIFGMAVTLVTSASREEEARRYFEEIGIPFSKPQNE